MVKSALSLLILVLSIFGIADASYLSYEKLSGNIPGCGPGFDCAGVLYSKWASIGPIPLSVLGLFFYSLVFLFGVLHFLELDLKKFNQTLRMPFNFKPLHFLQVLVSFGLLFSIYLLIIMGIILEAWCQYCLYSAIISMLLFIIVFIYTNLVEKKSPALLKWLWYRLSGLVYQHLAKPMLFLFEPELVHESISAVGSIMGEIPGIKQLTGSVYSYRHPKTKRLLANISFTNPVGLAAGYDYNGNLTQILPKIGFGFLTIGTITFGSYGGNPKPTYLRLKNSKSLIVNKGLKNLGAESIIKRLSNLDFQIPIGVSIASTNKFFKNDKEQILDIIKCFALFEKSSVKHKFYELNISCPNTFGGEPFTSPSRLEILLQTIDHLKLRLPLFVKMPIDQGEAETLALLAICNNHHVDGVIFGNLSKDVKNPAVMPEDREVWKKSKGNLSGKPTWERSNKLIKLTKKNYKNRFVIIGTGGIFSAQDAQYKMSIGADLVQLITGMIFTGPQLIGSINQSLAEEKI
jgi:dihydroorotate dehydrogenase/uncharacterized membrane protein